MMKSCVWELQSVALLLIKTGLYSSTLWFLGLYSRMGWIDLFGVGTMIRAELLSSVQKNEDLNSASLWKCQGLYLSCVWVTFSICGWACAVFPLLMAWTSSKVEVQRSISHHDWPGCNSWGIRWNLVNVIWFWTSWSSTATSFERHVSGLNYLKVYYKEIFFFHQSFVLENALSSPKFSCIPPSQRKLTELWTQ